MQTTKIAKINAHIVANWIVPDDSTLDFLELK